MQENTNRMSINFLSLSENEQFARSCIQAFCLPLNPTISELNDVKTAVSEAVTNCIVHAYPGKIGEITINAEIISNALHIIISDNGNGIEDVEKAIEPFYTTRPDDERSGMGFTVMKAFMDEVKVTSVKAKGTVVEMIKFFSSSGETKKVKDVEAENSVAQIVWSENA